MAFSGAPPCQWLLKPGAAPVSSAAKRLGQRSIYFNYEEPAGRHTHTHLDSQHIPLLHWHMSAAPRALCTDKLWMHNLLSYLASLPHQWCCEAAGAAKLLQLFKSCGATAAARPRTLWSGHSCPARYGAGPGRCGK